MPSGCRVNGETSAPLRLDMPGRSRSNGVSNCASNAAFPASGAPGVCKRELGESRNGLQFLRVLTASMAAFNVASCRAIRSLSFPVIISCLIYAFNYHRGANTRRAAHHHEAKRAVTGIQAVEQGGHQNSAACAHGMTLGDMSAGDVHSCGIGLAVTHEFGNRDGKSFHELDTHHVLQ